MVSTAFLLAASMVVGQADTSFINLQSVAQADDDVGSLIQKAAIHTLRKQNSEAEACYRRVLEIVGEDDAASLKPILLLVDSIDKQGGRREEVLAILEAAMKKHRSTLGDDHEDVDAILRNISKTSSFIAWDKAIDSGKAPEEYNRAEEAALRVVELGFGDGGNWLLGLARLGQEDAEGSRDAMLASLGNIDESWIGQWFLMAMVESLNGNEQAAKDWYVVGVEWMDRAKNTWTPNKQLRARAESAVGASTFDFPEEWTPEYYLPHYDRLVKPHPNVARLWQFRSLLHARAGLQKQALADYAQLVEIYSEAIEKDPDNKGLIKFRGYMYALLEKWKEAASDFQAALDTQNDASNVWMQIPTILAMTGDKEAYRACCERMLARFRESELPADVERVIKVSLLFPDVFEVSDLPLKKLEEALSTEEGMGVLNTWGWACLALAEYRSGDAINAIQHAARAEGEKEYKSSLGAQTLTECVKALAYQDLKREGDARKAYAKATVLLEEHATSFAERGMFSHDVLISELLRREAEGRFE